MERTKHNHHTHQNTKNDTHRCRFLSRVPILNLSRMSVFFCPACLSFLSRVLLKLEADESPRLRVGESLPHHHQDRIAGKGENSLQHYNFVHKFILLPQAMKIPAANAAVDKEWENLEKISAWNLTKVRSNKEVIDEARMSGATVHFESLMYVCHLKNAELETKHQNIQRSGGTPR